MEESPNQIQQKNNEFRNEIKRKNKEAFFKKVRNEFLKLENPNDCLNPEDKLEIDDIDTLLKNIISKSNLENLNNFFIENQEIIDEKLFSKMLDYAIYFFNLEKSKTIYQKIYFNDGITFYSNLISFEQFAPVLISKLNFGEIARNLLNFAISAKEESSNLVVWLLFHITLIQPENTIPMISKSQLELAENIGITNTNLSYLLSNIAIEMPELLYVEIIELLLQQEMKKNLDKEFCRNVVQIFGQFILYHKKSSLTDSILKWTCKQLSSKTFPTICKDDLLLMIKKFFNKGIELTTLTRLVSEGHITYELVTRSLNEKNIKNKMCCIMSINDLIRQSPPSQRKKLIENHEEIIKILISSFDLMKNEITIASLLSIAYILMTFPNNKQLKDNMVREGIIKELEMLSNSENSRVSELANSLREELFHL